MRNTLCENIKHLRMQSGMNQVEFAKKMCVTKQCVSNWENDNILPSIEMLTKIADVLKVKTDYLLGREERVFIDVSGLTKEQIGHITLLVKDLETLNLCVEKYRALGLPFPLEGVGNLSPTRLAALQEAYLGIKMS